MNTEISNRSIDVNASMISALKQMEAHSYRLLLVFDGDTFVGVVSIGDIQRSVIKNKPMTTPIKGIMRKKFTFAHEGDDITDIKRMMFENRIEMMPILDVHGELTNVLFWEDLLKDKQPKLKQFNIPVVIMAGGKGERLKPLTNIYPKPLIPVCEKTIIETIMDKFVAHGCHDFLISLNYKADAIRHYFNQLACTDYNIQFFQEEKPMGTAGSLRFLKNLIKGTFFVSNCDILINDDYAAMLEYHHTNHNELTVVAAIKNYSIPYGTITTSEDGLLENFEEKPDLTLKINTGLYILEASLLDEIPNTFFHITHLMEKLKSQGRRVGVYPISQNDWQDMGDWHEYLKMIGQSEFTKKE